MSEQRNADADKKYQCPCGSTLSRRCEQTESSQLTVASDVLLRHIRKCPQAQETLARSDSSSRRPSRSKTACNECALSRLKCDSKTPCSRCEKKSLRCEYTRKGYSDPYKAFRIPPSKSRADESRPDVPPIQSIGTSGGESSSSGSLLLPTPLDSTASAGSGQGDVLDFGGVDFSTPLEYMNASLLSGYGSTNLIEGFQDLDWDSLMTFPELTDGVTPAVSAPMTSLGFTETNMAVAEPSWNFSQGLHLQQIDSVEAKCAEIRTYIAGSQTSQTGVDHSVLARYVTRDRLVTCIQHYAKCFQSIQPILHLPTFELTKTPPDLLAAMMLVGACYASNVIPPTTVVQGAIHMLLLSEHSAYERAMTAPPLASIQANALLCQLLILTQNSQAYCFATMHRTRTISMAERAGLFNAEPAASYWDLDWSAFDWHAWSESEMRRRLAHHIFVDDIGGSIFTRSSSYMSPFTFQVNTPCYSDCWVAPTAIECWERLRSTPRSIQVSAAVKQIRSASPMQGPYLFDASDCGMLETIIALHSILFRTMEESLDDENNVPQLQPQDEHEQAQANAAYMNVSDLLTRNLANYDIANIANEMVAKYGSESMRRVNSYLDAWQRNWHARRIHDMYDDRRGAFTHPMNFLLLAKLFIIVHFFRNCYHPQPQNAHGVSPTTAAAGMRSDDMHQPPPQQQPQGRDVGAEGDGLLAFYNCNSGTSHSQGRLIVQVHVIGWLARIRQQRDGKLLSAGSFLSEVLSA